MTRRDLTTRTRGPKSLARCPILKGEGDGGGEKGDAPRKRIALRRVTLKLMAVIKASSRVGCVRERFVTRKSPDAHAQLRILGFLALSERYLQCPTVSRQIVAIRHDERIFVRVHRFLHKFLRSSFPPAPRHS